MQCLTRVWTTKPERTYYMHRSNRKVGLTKAFCSKLFGYSYPLKFAFAALMSLKSFLLPSASGVIDAEVHRRDSEYGWFNWAGLFLNSASLPRHGYSSRSSYRPH